MKKSVLTIAIILATASVGGLLVSAQPQQPPQQPPPQEDRKGPPPPHDPLGDALFPPDLIMSHQRELGLTDEQKIFMRGEIQRTTTRFNELQWQLQDAMESLHDTMKANTVNEQMALSQLDKVLDSEREIKRMHMELAIRLKNKLTPDQQAKLQRMRQDMKPPRDGGPGMGPGMGPHRRPGSGPGGGGPGGGGPGGPPQRPDF